MNDLHEFSVGTFMPNQVKDMAPIVIDDMIVRNRDMHSYFIRSAKNVHTAFRRTHKVTNGFLKYGVTIIFVYLAW